MRTGGVISCPTTRPMIDLCDFLADPSLPYYGPSRLEDFTGEPTIWYEPATMQYTGRGQLSLHLPLKSLVYTPVKHNHQLELLWSTS
jgi:hypothetical protein